MVQWLRLHASNAGLIPGQEARSHLQQLKILHATTKTPCSQINKIKKTKPKQKHSRSLEELWDLTWGTSIGLLSATLRAETQQWPRCPPPGEGHIVVNT